MPGRLKTTNSHNFLLSFPGTPSWVLCGSNPHALRNQTMQIIASTSEKLKKEVSEAANSCNLSVSAFVKLAVSEKMKRMEKEQKIKETE